jgi:DNA-binding transcriptional regulator YiaG
MLIGELIEVVSMQKSILEVVHESVEGLSDAGLVDAITMHEFNVTCLTSKDLSLLPNSNTPDNSLRE